MREYLRLTKTHSYSLLFAIPLLLAYELGAAFLARTPETALRNGADVLLRALLSLGGVEGTAALTGALLLAAAALILLERRRRRVPLRPRLFVAMAAESLLYAMVFGAVVGGATRWVLQGLPLLAQPAGGPVAALPLPHAIVLSLGAGIYEELVFRVLLVGAAFSALTAAGVRRLTAAGISAVVAALVFSGFHYIGVYGDPWAVSSFVFRFLAGLAFSLLFLGRGFGITAWTHALYDVLIFVARGR